MLKLTYLLMWLLKKQGPNLMNCEKSLNYVKQGFNHVYIFWIGGSEFDPDSTNEVAEPISNQLNSVEPNFLWPPILNNICM